MKLPYCPDCKAKSVLTWDVKTNWTLACSDCGHKVTGHVRSSQAIKAFLWDHGPSGNQYTAMSLLACGCPLSGCKHPMFEAE